VSRDSNLIIALGVPDRLAVNVAHITTDVIYNTENRGNIAWPGRDTVSYVWSTEQQSFRPRCVGSSSVLVETAPYGGQSLLPNAIWFSNRELNGRFQRKRVAAERH